MALVFPTAPEAVLAAVRRDEAGKASGATNAIREIGAVLGVAVLASVFAANGGYESPEAFTSGPVSALPIAVVVLAAGAAVALMTPGRAGAEAVAAPRVESAPATASLLAADHLTSIDTGDTNMQANIERAESAAGLRYGAGTRARHELILGAAAIATGLLAGLFYAYACSIMPGLHASSDRTAVEAMQNINEAIQNPVFFPRSWAPRRWRPGRW